MEMCYHMFIYAEFEMMNMFFLKKDAQNISRRTLLIRNFFLHCSCLYWDFSLVMEIWFKVLEKSWKPIGQNV